MGVIALSYAHAIGILVNTALRMSGGPSNTLNSMARSISNPTGLGAKIAAVERNPLSGASKDILQELATRPFGLINQPRQEPGKLLKTRSTEGLNSSELVHVRIICQDRNTGMTSTFDVLDSYDNLDKILQNPQGAIRRAGDEGCSGAPGTDVDVSAEIVN